jgi:DNA end-binding protein Ku
MWSGTVTFGLVSVPVKLYSAVKQKDVRFHLLHDQDGARIQERRVCSAEGKEVPYEHVVKGYEVSRGQYVVVTKEELAALDPKATRTIDIEDFVDLAEIDPVYYDHTYYLAPDRGGAKAYALLREAMEKMKKVAIARVVLRTKQYLCAIRPLGPALALSTMLWADEVLPASQLEGVSSAQPKAREKELAMAQQLIETLVTDFQPDKYRDDYREQVLAMLERKAQGKQIVTAPEEARPAKVIDLMDALKASLASGKRAAPPAGPRRARARQARRPRARRRAARRSA